MSNTYQPESLHPYIMNDRLKKATGSGGIGNIPIASADTVGGIMIGGSANPITIDGSGNASVRKATAELLGVIKAGDGVSINADGAISVDPIIYSTAEVDTGKTWTDGKKIYRKSYKARNLSANANYTIDDALTTSVVDSLIKVDGSFSDSSSIYPNNYAWSTERGIPVIASTGFILLISGTTITGFDFTIEYTKQTTP